MDTLETPCPLEATIATRELRHRPSPPARRADESRAFLRLTQALSQFPQDFYHNLVRVALELSGAGSTGISLLNVKTARFVWPAVAGELKSYLGSGTPSDFGPCGTVIDRDSTLLFIHPERHFTYLAPITPPLEEVLLIPFHKDGKAVGTIWAVSHEQEHKFTEEDRRLLESLSQFAASAYRVLAKAGALQPLLDMQPSGEG